MVRSVFKKPRRAKRRNAEKVKRKRTVRRAVVARPFFSTTSRRVRQCRTRVSRDVLRRRLRRLRRRQLRARLGLARAPAERRRVRAPGDHAAGILRRGPVVHEPRRLRGGYGQNAGPGSARAPRRGGVQRPGRIAAGVRAAAPGRVPAADGGGFQPAQRRFGDGGYGGVGAGPGLSAPTGRGGDGGYGGLPPRAFERSSAFGTGPGDRGAMQDAAPRRGFADSPLAQGVAPERRSRIRRIRRRAAAGAFSLASATTAGASASSAAGGRRLGASAFVNPQRELVTPQAPHPEGARPTFSLEKFGITGDNAAAHDRAASSAGGTRFSSRAGSGANSPGTASPPGAGGAGDGGAARAQTRRLPLYVGADLPAADPNAAAARRRRPTRSRKPRRWRRGDRPWRRRTQL